MKIAEVKRKQNSTSRAHRVLALIRAILRSGERMWAWLDKARTVRMYQEAKRRVRWLTPEQAATLLKVLPDHQRETVLFALATNLRQANVVTAESSRFQRKLLHARERRNAVKFWNLLATRA